MPTSSSPPANPKLAAKLILAICGSALAAIPAYFIWQATQPKMSTATLTIDTDTAPEASWNGSKTYVIDAVSGFRPARSTTIRLKMAALDGKSPQDIAKRRNSQGFLREDDLPTKLLGPRVIVLGDSHVDGIVNTADNFTSLVEARLRASENKAIWILNAGCGLYSLYQYALRASTVVPEFKPQVLVVTVFTGNDFLDLENRKAPTSTTSRSPKPQSKTHLQRPPRTGESAWRSHWKVHSGKA